MPKGHQRHALSDRLRNSLSNEHAGIVDYIEELQVYAKENPDDNWAQGQLRYFLKREKQLAEKLGLARNRAPR